jgi:predicted cupin superfamily sugar epimerase
LKKIEELVTRLDLKPHVEGGFFRETFRSPQTVTIPNLGERNLSTLIYFLLPSGQFSRFHRISSDELWMFQMGAPLLLHTIDESGNLETQSLGPDLASGEKPQILIPANTIFGAEVAEEGDFTLAACLVSPGFDFADFQLFDREHMLSNYSQHEVIIERLHQFEMNDEH